MTKGLCSLFVALMLAVGIRAQPGISDFINVNDIDIVRDKWGVPHIFGKTDAETAYGLAWATCEDDFKTVQEMLFAVRGKLAEVQGKAGAIMDFLAYITGTDKAVDAAYDTAFTPAYKKVLEAYVSGVNAYANSHPDEILMKGIFPLTGRDVIKEFVFTNMLLTSVYIDVQKIWQRSIKSYEVNYPFGSNAFAFDTSRTADGKTYLGINSHQPLEGMFSWYEAHLVSNEGMNILGGTFPGGVSIYLGANPNLGWACTLNHPDMDDVYKLDMNPDKPLEYWFDDHWEKLEVRKKTIKIKLTKYIKIPITKTFYWSKYGTTLKNDDGFYAIRFASNMDIRSPEEIYRMDKAKSFSEWYKALSMNAIPGINFVYADRTDTIFYISAAMLPYRDKRYDWRKVLPGNTSTTLWPARFHPLTELPQMLKPHCGYFVSTNNSCYDVTAPGCNPDPAKYDPTFGYGFEKNNRSIMAHYMIGKLPKLTYDDFKRVKYNRSFNDSIYDYNLDNILTMIHLSPVKYPDLADALEIARSWNHDCSTDDKEVALVMTAIYKIIDKINAAGTSYDNNTYPEKEYVAALRYAKKYMLHYFHSLRVPMGDVQKHVRGNVELPIGGGPEVLAATITEPYKNGMRKSFVGDSYIEMVRFSKDAVEIESVNAYGASAKPSSPHYTDQMKMFVNQQLKPMTLDRDAIYRNAESVYHPVKQKGKSGELATAK